MTNNHQVNMGTSNSTVILSDEQSQKINAAVEIAVSKWKQARQEKNEEGDLSSFKNYVTERVTKSVLAGTERTASELAKTARLKALRADRNSMIKDLELAARSHGIDFLTIREYNYEADTRLIANVMGRLISPVKQLINNQGGLIICSAPYLLMPTREIGCEVSMSICRKDEQFDLVDGMELALHRFFDKQTLLIKTNIKDRKLMSSDFSNEELRDLVKQYRAMQAKGFPKAVGGA